MTVFDKVNSDDAGPQWLSISALLDDLATSLETGMPFDGGGVTQSSTAVWSGTSELESRRILGPYSVGLPAVSTAKEGRQVTQSCMM